MFINNPVFFLILIMSFQVKFNLNCCLPSLQIKPSTTHMSANFLFLLWAPYKIIMRHTNRLRISVALFFYLVQNSPGRQP